jgi:hypothetical protein
MMDLKCADISTFSSDAPGRVGGKRGSVAAVHNGFSGAVRDFGNAVFHIGDAAEEFDLVSPAADNIS